MSEGRSFEARVQASQPPLRHLNRIVNGFPRPLFPFPGTTAGPIG